MPKWPKNNFLILGKYFLSVLWFTFWPKLGMTVICHKNVFLAFYCNFWLFMGTKTTKKYFLYVCNNFETNSCQKIGQICRNSHFGFFRHFLATLAIIQPYNHRKCLEMHQKICFRMPVPTIMIRKPKSWSELLSMTQKPRAKSATRATLDRVIDSPSKAKFESGPRRAKKSMGIFSWPTGCDTGKPRVNATHFFQKQGIRDYPP